MSMSWKNLGLALSALGAIVGIAGGVVASKQMEQAVDEAVERRLNPPEQEEEDP